MKYRYLIIKKYTLLSTYLLIGTCCYAANPEQNEQHQAPSAAAHANPQHHQLTLPQLIDGFAELGYKWAI